MANKISFRSRSLVFFIVFCLALTGGCGEEPPKSRLEKRASLHLNKMEASAVDLEKAMKAVAGARVLNTPERMQKAAQLTEAGRKCIDQANNHARAYIAFVNAHKTELKAENLDRYVLLTELLSPDLMAKRQAMQAYFIQMKKWLDYASANYEAIRSNDAQCRRSYDALLIDANRSLDAYGKARQEYLGQTQEFMASHPWIKEAFKRQYKTMKKELGWL